MTVVIDYGAGNLFSLCSSLKAAGAEDIVVTGESDKIAQADRVVLPGVGAFGDAARMLSQTGLDRVVKARAEAGVPLLGICLGMQLLFEEGREYGAHRGLGLIEGRVIPLKGRVPPQLPVPHMGWNALEFCNPSPIFKYIHNGEFVYFVHSFFAENCEKSRIATAEYGLPITAAVQRENVFGCQFHPEKSGRAGLAILKAFLEEHR